MLTRGNGTLKTADSSTCFLAIFVFAPTPSYPPIMAEARYPSTPHLPFSPGIADDDTQLPEASPFVGVEVVVTEKMDGGNTCLHDGKVYARTHSHEATGKWFGPVKALYSQVGHLVDASEALYGETMVAIHSIEYDALRSYFLLFGIHRTSGNQATWMSWDDVEQRADEIGLVTVPVCFRGVFQTAADMESWMSHAASQPSQHGNHVQPEGFVIRVARGFGAGEFDRCVAKYVRKGHVQTTPDFKRSVSRGIVYVCSLLLGRGGKRRWPLLLD